MGGWLQFIGSMAGAGANALDRYQALNQRDFQNQLLQAQQARQDQLAQQQQQMSERQQQLLDLAIMKQKQEDFLTLHGPGQDLTPEDEATAQGAGLGSLVQHGSNPNYGLSSSNIQDLTQGTSPVQNPLELIQSNADPLIDQPASVANQAPVLGSTPYSRFTGTPAQIQQQQQLQFANTQRNNLLSAIQGLDVNDPASLAKYNALIGKPIDVRELEMPSKGASPFGSGVEAGSIALWQQQHPGEQLTPEVIGKLHQMLNPPNQQPVDQAALQGMINWALSTGTPPGFGMNNAAGRNAFYAGINPYVSGQQVNPLTGLPFNPAGQHAINQGNVASIKNLQPMVDLVKGYHSAIDKNAQVLQGTFDKLDDFGSQIVNENLRDLGKKFADPTGNIAAFQAAAIPVLREYARITNNPRLTGQFSFEAQKEVNDMLNNGFTMNQFYQVWNVMQKDMNNVDSSLQDALSGAQTRAQSPGGLGNTQPVNGGWKLVDGVWVKGS